MNATNYVGFEVAKQIAVEYKNETAVSERKMAEKYGVPRSRIQKVKKEVQNGEWDEVLTPVQEQEFSHNVRQTKVSLQNKTHQNAPTKKARALYELVSGNFDKFTESLLESNPNMTQAYINGQYHRCQNAE